MSHNGETLDDRTVRELLAGKHKLVEVEPDAPVHLAAKRMCEHGVGGLLVSAGDEIAGIFTERDILTKVVCELREPAETRVEQGMTSEDITVDIETARHAWHATRRLAQTHGLTVYDAACLELAQRRRLPLATLDTELAGAARQAGIEVLP